MSSISSVFPSSATSCSYSSAANLSQSERKIVWSVSRLVLTSGYQLSPHFPPRQLHVVLQMGLSAHGPDISPDWTLKKVSKKTGVILHLFKSCSVIWFLVAGRIISNIWLTKNIKIKIYKLPWWKKILPDKDSHRSAGSQLTLRTWPSCSVLTLLWLCLEKASLNFLVTASTESFPVGLPLGK